ncbi:CLUMA_CG001368, isoform A [Clunio marinus]|uniref:CLUMA_CG001368, isoform A n=1 Tax=Clunio marinus TaxID=568069 RepID=A0A1J1HI45_9DIPT|nr:CLUMA_CG001368, isoform A [Clunio marinus]
MKTRQMFYLNSRFVYRKRREISEKRGIILKWKIYLVSQFMRRMRTRKPHKYLNFVAAFMMAFDFDERFTTFISRKDVKFMLYDKH